MKRCIVFLLGIILLGFLSGCPAETETPTITTPTEASAGPSTSPEESTEPGYNIGFEDYDEWVKAKSELEDTALAETFVTDTLSLIPMVRAESPVKFKFFWSDQDKKTEHPIEFDGLKDDLKVDPDGWLIYPEDETEMRNFDIVLKRFHGVRHLTLAVRIEKEDGNTVSRSITQTVSKEDSYPNFQVSVGKDSISPIGL